MYAVYVHQGGKILDSICNSNHLLPEDAEVSWNYLKYCYHIAEN
jgi:hypothetical protein